MPFGRIFEGRNRGEIVGLFVALLELVRQKRVLASQEGSFGEIHVHLNPNAPQPEEPDAEDATADESPEPPTENAPEVAEDDKGSAEEGRYISSQQEHPDDAGRDA